MSVIFVGFLLVLLAAATLVISRGHGKPSEDWDEFLASNPDPLARALAAPAKAMSVSSTLRGINPESFENMEGRLKLGGAFYGNLTIFLAYQVVALLVAAGLLIVSMLDFVPMFFRVVIILSAIVVASWPYSTVSKVAKERENDIRIYLPEFAELLLMVLASMSVPQALSFTSSKLDGPIAVEMRELVRTLSTRTLPEEQAFELTANRLGTSEGRQFVSALKVAYIDGAKAVEPIRAQVNQLRALQFQRQRALAKKLPVGMVVTFAVHFMPLLFILAFLPVFYAMSGAM